MTRVTLGIKAGGLSRGRAYSPEASGVASRLLFTSVQLVVLSHLDNAHLWRIQEQLRPIGFSSFPHAVHDGNDLSLGVKPGMDMVYSQP